jgi:predicted phage gp36 major capsid-like protein
MSIEKVLEKVDAIEASNLQKIDAVKSEVAATVDAAKAEMAEKVAALEAKVASVQAPEIMRTRAKTVKSDVNRMVAEQLKDIAKSNSRTEKEIKLFESVDQYDAYHNEASALTGSGYDKGGRTSYDPTFVMLRQMNPMRGVSRQVATDGAVYQFRAKTGDAGATWGYPVATDNSSQDTNIWQLVLKDVNTRFPIRTAALDDIDGLEGNLVSDMLAEFSQVEGQSMILNDDQTSNTSAYGGTNGLRGLNYYAGASASASYSGGSWGIDAAFSSTSGTGTSAGIHTLRTYDQTTTNAAATANNVKYADLINFIHGLPVQYWTSNAKWVVSPLFLAAVRGLVDNQGTPVFERMSPLVTDGIVGKLLGFDVVVNSYISSPYSNSTTAGTSNRFPAYFGDFQKGHTIVDRLSMIMRRYDQTIPGSIVYYGEKRLASSVVDPKAIVRWRSTATANAAG